MINQEQSFGAAQFFTQNCLKICHVFHSYAKLYSNCTMIIFRRKPNRFSDN